MRATPDLDLGRETAISLGSKLVTGVIGFVGIVVFARALGPTGFGVYKTALVAALVLTQLPNGVGLSLRKRLSEVDVDPPEYLGAGLLVHGGFSLIVILAFLMFGSFVRGFFGSTEIVAAIVAIVVTIGLFNVINHAYAGTGYPARSLWFDALRSLLTFLLQLLFIWLSFAAFGLLLGLAIATLATAVLAGIAMGVRPALPTVRTARRIYTFARWSVPVSLLTNLYASMDILILAVLVGSGSVGLYTTASQLTIPGAMYASSIRDALAVKSSGLASAGSGVRFDLKNAVSYSGLLSIPLFFGALAMPQSIMTTVFGRAYTDGAAVLVGLALFQVLNVYRLPFEATVEGLDRPATVFRVNLLVVGSHLPLAIGLGFVYGLLGVVAATVTTEAVRVGVYQYVAHRDLGGIVVTRPIFEQLLSGAIMFVAVSLLLNFAVTVTSWLWLVAVVIVGAATYFGLLGLISSHFRATLAQVAAPPAEW